MSNDLYNCRVIFVRVYMRICIIADALDKNNAGISQYVRQMIIHLKRDHELTIIRLKKSSDAVFSGVREIVIPRLFHFPLMPKIYVDLFLRNLDVDIIHYPSHIGSFFFPIKKKLVQTIPDVIPWKLPETRNNVRDLGYKLLTKPSIRNMDAIMTLSQSSKRDICSLFGIPEKKVFVVPLASSFEKPSSREVLKIKSKYKLSYPYFLFVGTLEPRKNLVRALQAFARSGLNDYHFVFVGNAGWKYDDVFKTIDILGLKNRVHVFSGVPNEDLPGFYAGSESLVFVSLYEGFGLPIVEAMSCGCPVITSSTSSMPEVGGKAALYVNPLDIDNIAQSMRDVLEKRSVLVREGFKQAKKFSWEIAVQKTVEVYEKVMRS